jgi:hypothetical protein
MLEPCYDNVRRDLLASTSPARPPLAGRVRLQLLIVRGYPLACRDYGRRRFPTSARAGYSTPRRSRRTTVSTTETSKEPRQPRRLEKNRKT